MNLELKDVGKVYDKKVLDGIHLKMSNGVYGLLGPNGVGKSTLIRLICNIEPVTTGIITYGREEIGMLDEKYREILGYVPQKTGFYEDFTAQEFLGYMSVMKGLSAAETEEQIGKVLDLVNLTDVRNKRIKTFSGGMKQRVNIAQALLNNPQILILDEPTVGLDLKERMNFKQFVSEFASDRIVIFATHIVSDIEDIGSEIIIMKDGRIQAKDTTDNLLKLVEGRVWEIECQKAELKELKKKGKVSNTRINGNDINLRLVADEKPCDVAKSVAGNLQDLYLHLFDTVSE